MDASNGLKEEPDNLQELCISDQDFVLEPEEEEIVDFPDRIRDIINGLKEDSLDCQYSYASVAFQQNVKEEEIEISLEDMAEAICTGLKEEPTDHQDISRLHHLSSLTAREDDMDQTSSKPTTSYNFRRPLQGSSAEQGKRACAIGEELPSDSTDDENIGSDGDWRPGARPISSPKKQSGLGKNNQSGKTFRTKENLKRHQGTDEREKLLFCPMCRKRFSFKSALKLHLRTHTGERPYACQLCGKRLSCKHNLRNHMKIHTGETPYSCQMCGKRFIHLEVLRRHVRVHTGEQPYSCQHCGRRFCHNANLKRHQRTHTGEKPYVCEICGRRFSAKFNLTLHLRIHTGEKPYSCQQCGKRFTLNRLLKTHLRTHAIEAPCFCKQCGKIFNNRDSFTRHLKIHTGAKCHVPLLMNWMQPRVALIRLEEGNLCQSDQDFLLKIKTEETLDSPDQPRDISIGLKKEPGDSQVMYPPRDMDASTGVKEEPSNQHDLCYSDQNFVLKTEEEEIVVFPDPTWDISTGLKEEPLDEQLMYTCPISPPRKQRGLEKRPCCEKCGKRFRSKMSLRQHRRVTKRKKLFFCEPSGKRLS